MAQAVWAEDYIISGHVLDAQGNAPMEMVTVRLMKADSSFVTGAMTMDNGSFSIDAKKAGSYILKFSFLGYNTQFRNVTLTKEKASASLGNVTLSANDRLLKEATVKARAAKVQIVKDTFIYNVAAYRVPEGATLEALVEQLPGAIVDDDGNITLNGKAVSEILVEGKDFFKGDTKVAMKNLPVTLIDKVKAYDKKSDYTRETGIDDGNEKTVLDLQLKQKLKGAIFSNANLGIGNHDRYNARMFGNYFTDNQSFSVFANLNNTNDRGGMRGGGPGFRGGGSGLNASKNVGINRYWNNGKKDNEAGYLQLNGNVRYNHNNSDNASRGNSETFLNDRGSSSFSNSRSQSYGHSWGWSGEFNLRWRPDTMTSIYVRPEFSYSENDSRSQSRSATFNADPYEQVDNPLDDIFSPAPTLASIAVNRNDRQSLSDGSTFRTEFDAGVTRRLNSKGRSISFDGGLNYNKGKSHSYSISDIYYYQRGSQTYNNQYSTSPTKNWGFNTRLSYSEPIVKNLFFEGSYNYRYSYQDRDRTLYQLDSLADWRIPGRHLIGTLPSDDSLALAINTVNSRYATYNNYTHNINLGIRYVTSDLNFNVGIRLQPQRTKLDYKKDLLDTVVTRNVFNVAPNLRLRYNISRYSRLEFRYRGSSSQPSMTDLLDITDTSNPLHITMGNPGLKPSWTNNVNAYFNKNWTESQTNISVDLSYSQTSNSISNAMTYDQETGVTTTRPENINGNWNTRGNVMFSTAFGSDKQFNFWCMSDANYRHQVGFLRTEKTSSEKNLVKSLELGERMRVSYRNDFIEVGLNGTLDYNHSRSQLRSQSNLDTWRFAYGGSLQWNTTWNMSLSTNIAMNSRRGYDDASMNTNELIWNAQLTQSFLKNNAATLSLECYDILHEQSNISRNISALSRSDNWSNGIHSYIMLRFSYRFNLFGGGQGRMKMNGGGGDRGGQRGERGGQRSERGGQGGGGGR